MASMNFEIGSSRGQGATKVIKTTRVVPFSTIKLFPNTNFLNGMQYQCCSVLCDTYCTMPTGTTPLQLMQ